MDAEGALESTTETNRHQSQLCQLQEASAAFLLSMTFSEKLSSLLGFRCPKCGKGDLFVQPNAYRLKDIAEMHPNCSACGEDFLREPGFYFGAAYVSYALTVALWVALLVALLCFDAWGWIEFGMFTHAELYLGLGIALLLGLLPLLYRLSRSLWIALFTG